MSQKTDSYGSRFLYSEDLLFKQEYKTVQVTIAEVIPPGELEAADGRQIGKWSLRFEGKDKLLVLCKTNVGLIHHILGNPPGADWVGEKLTLQVRLVEAFGDQVAAIRVMPPNGCKVRKSLLDRLGKKAEWQGAN